MAVAVAGIILLALSVWLVSDAMTMVQEEQFDTWMASDISHLRDELGEYDGAQWRLESDGLYVGDNFIGDGTVEHANETVLNHFKEISGTDFYIFIKTSNDMELGYVQDAGYEEGHYLRAAGSTRGTNNEQLEGTYIDKKVSDKLEASEDGIYSGYANVNGRTIYCRYELIKDAAGNNIAIISSGRGIEDLKPLIKKERKRSAILHFIFILVICFGLGTVIQRMLKKVGEIKDRLEAVGTGDFSQQPLQVKSGDEFEEIANSINEMVKSLQEKERIGAELSLARDIQSNMLPRIFPPFPDHEEFDIFASMDAAKEVGGDFYDMFMIDDRHVAVVIADVSGKGIPAALVMVVTKTLIKNHAQLGMEPCEVFTMVNDMLSEDNDVGFFITSWMGVIDVETGVMKYVNAGHNPPLIMHEGGDYEYLISKPGMVLAAFGGMKYTQSEIGLSAGSRLLLYTDGVTEANNTSNELYGPDRLKDYLNANRDANLKETLTGLRKDVDIFAEGAEQADDITMLIFEYRQKGRETKMKEKTFPAEVDSLGDALGFVEAELEKLDCPMDAMMQISVCVEEMFVNVANYAYQGEPGEVKLSIDEEEGSVSITLTDEGVPFDPLAKEDPDITLALEDRPLGGLGILMVKKSMNEVNYERKDGKNIFRMKKNFH